MKATKEIKAITKLVIRCYQEKYRIQKDIDEAQLEILELDTELSGLAHHGTKMTPEQAACPLPLPHTTSPHTDDQRMLELIERKDELEKRIDYLVHSLHMAGKVSLLSTEDQQLMHDLYHSRRNLDAIAFDHGMNPSSVHKHLTRALNKVL